VNLSAMVDALDNGDGGVFLGPVVNRSNHAKLEDFVSDNKGRVIISHINCNHLLPHINDLRIMYQNSTIDVIGVNETFLNEAIPSAAVEIKGYNFLRNDRTVLGRPNVQGGGVGIYLKSEIKYRILAKSKEIGIEFIFVEIIINANKILIASVYRPPSTSVVYQSLSAGNFGLLALEDTLSELLPLYNEVFLFGDFNINLLSTSDPLFDSISELLLIFMLYNVSDAPTRDASGTLLDLFLVSNPVNIKNFFQTSVPWSDHDAIVLSCDINKGCFDISKKWVRNFKNIEGDDFVHAAAELDWSSIMYVSGVNEKIDLFYAFIRLLLDTFAPMKLVKLQQNKSLNGVENWITDEILRLIEDRDRAYKLWHDNINRRKNDSLWVSYMEKKRQTKKVVVENHSKFVELNLDPNLPSEKLYGNLRKFGLMKRSTLTDTVDVDALNAFFITKPAPNSDLNFNVPCRNDVPEFTFSVVDHVDVYEAVNAVKSNAAGCDEIPLSIIKLLLPVILPILVHIYNYIFACCEYPRQWKSAIVLPIPKVSNPSGHSDFRPISLLSCLSKVFEVMMAKQINKHIREHNLLSDYQSGFRKFHSTTTAILKVTEDIRSNLEEGCATVLVLLDFSQAFDKVVHELLLLKLKNKFRFSTDSNALMNSYLTGRTQFVRSGENDSSSQNVLCGVPQGSVLGPLLYVSYSNDVGCVIQICSFHMYADDLQLYRSSSVENLQQCYEEINEDLKRIYEWSNENGLKLNPKKSQVLVINRSKKLISQPKLFVGQDTIKIVNKVVDLGFVINDKLTPVDHCNKICQKTYYVLRSIIPHASCTPLPVRKKLITSLVKTHFDYGNIVYSTYDCASKRKLQKAYNACLRYVYKRGRRDSLQDLQCCLWGLTPENSAKLQLLLFLFKLIHVHHPSYLYTLFTFASSVRMRNFILPINHTLAKSQSFSVVAAKAWNQLHYPTRSMSTLGRFKAAVIRQLG
jgi:hypothetical protein